MLRVDNIRVNYGDFQALIDVSLVVKKGEIVALLGSNGAGKTTTINTISGITDLVDGDITFEGKSIKDKPAFERVSDGIIQVPEGRKLFPGMSVLENLIVGSYVKSARKQRKENLDMVMELFPKLKERRSQMAGSLSGGEQQMVAIARGLMACPKILMMDEPSLGLAPVIVDQIFEIILDINKAGITILLVEQNVAASLEIAHHAFVIETGNTVMSGEAKKLSQDKKLQKFYLGL
jgi:branched-chain amino acid transport system ATP-binding protein